MNEKAALSRARDYLRQLSEGIDPIRNDSLAEDSALREERLRRCFAFVAAYLDRELSRPDPAGGALSLSEEAARELVAKEDLPMGEFRRRLSEASVRAGGQPISAKAWNHFLLRAGVVSGRIESVFIDRKVLSANSVSEQVGIYEKSGLAPVTGELTRTLMISPEGQAWILRNLDAIAAEQLAASIPTQNPEQGGR